MKEVLIMLKAIDVAKWFINNVQPEPLKLQKLLYLSQGYSYAFNGRPLFDDEMEAWVHGPVVPYVYRQYQNYQYNPIMINYSLPIYEDEDLTVMKYVKDTFSKYDSKYLEELSHEQEPWIEARSGLDPDERSHKVIDKELISNFFMNLVSQPSEEEWDR